MVRISQNRVTQAFAAGDAAPTSHARGKALEDLLLYLFCKIPGVRLIRRNVLTGDGSEEIDLVFWNDKSVLDFLPNVLLFECKNWNGPVTSASVSFFISKAVARHLPHAFLIAAQGLTGDADQLNHAHAHLHNALTVNDCKIVILTRADLVSLSDTKQLVTLIIDRISELYLLGV